MFSSTFPLHKKALNCKKMQQPAGRWALLYNPQCTLPLSVGTGTVHCRVLCLSARNYFAGKQPHLVTEQTKECEVSQG